MEERRERTTQEHRNAQEFRELMSELRWSQETLSIRLGVHRNSVSAWAQGRCRVPGPARAYMVLAARVQGLGEQLRWLPHV